MNKELPKEIQDRVEELETRIVAGEKIIYQCKQQLKMLKRKVKEYKHLKEQVQIKIIEAADGDL